ncbi:MAG: Mur ligase domain-containing protein [Cyclobacteriaceae bacterium]|nr:peptidoglycan synthetase [Cyclobacteriaceae bacterium]MCH8514704.1 Mur ligase domain-containing protein [Cyclobacteriaceae bacterium]
MQESYKRVHFIAIGGSVMHNLALALQAKGIEVSGSDDQIFDPAASKLKQAGIFPESLGWDESRISNDLDAVILGMHAKADNPELKKAQDLGLSIFSYPEFVMTQITQKQRVVIAGSHGKTTVTAMVMHVLKTLNRDFDYLIGASVPNFDLLVKLTDAPVVILEGDEYPASALQLKPKFSYYDHHIGVITGIAWDHVNIYKTFDDYVKPFETFADNTPKAGTLIYCEEDNFVSVIGNKGREDVTAIPYKTHAFENKNGKFQLKTDQGDVVLEVFGQHNMQNLSAAKEVCKKLGVQEKDFYHAIASFKGADRRLELLSESDSVAIFKDFAHSPSKLRASTDAVKQRNPERDLVACIELHSFSSVNKDFLSEYEGTFSAADKAIVFFNPEVAKRKNMVPPTEAEIIAAFGRNDLVVVNQPEELKQLVQSISRENVNILLMTSGSFEGLDLTELLA